MFVAPALCPLLFYDKQSPSRVFILYSCLLSADLNYFSLRTEYKSASHMFLLASLGIRQSPRGDRETEPTFGPSGRQERLNCWAKKRR